MKRYFVETPPFKRYIDDLPNGQEILLDLQESLLDNPEAGDLIVGTGGLRKIRLAGKGKGKSGGFRITYLYVQKFECVYLFVIYAKNEKENLSQREKALLKKVVEDIKEEK